MSTFTDLQARLQKPRVRALEKLDRAKRKQSIEDRENAKVKARSLGQCEMREVVVSDVFRCRKNAYEIHHLLGGSGKRGVRESALAINKLHVCSFDHQLITEHILQPSCADLNDRAGTTTYVRLA